MADGAPLDYSYSPSGSTIELIDLASTRPSSWPSTRISSAGSTSPSWHPKLTLYRLLVILSTVGLAAAKSATSYLNLTFASITLEWILGVVAFLFFYLLGAYETSNRNLTWLFHFDCMEYLWAFLENFTGFSRPHYISDEIDARHEVAGIHPPLTGYRILVTVMVASVGMTKSALLYGQEPMEATTMDCVYGVGIVTGLYWLGLYEASSTKAYPKLFHVDYSGGFKSSYITETVIVFLHLFALLFCCAASYGLYLFTAMFVSPDSPAKGRMEIVDYVVMIVMGSTLSMMSLGSVLLAFLLMLHLGRRYLASPLGQFIVGLPGVRLIPYVHRKYWLPSAVSPRPRPRFFYLKRLFIRQSVKIPWRLFMLYIIVIMLIYCVAFCLGWYSFFMNLPEKDPWYILLIYFLMSLFHVPMLLGTIAAMIYFVCKGVIDFFFEAWKDFTVDVELPV